MCSTLWMEPSGSLGATHWPGSNVGGWDVLPRYALYDFIIQGSRDSVLVEFRVMGEGHPIITFYRGHILEGAHPSFHPAEHTGPGVSTPLDAYLIGEKPVSENRLSKDLCPASRVLLLHARLDRVPSLHDALPEW